VLIGRDPAAGILITIPPHRGEVTLTFNLHNRHTFSEEQMKDPRAAYARYTATIGALTQDNTLLSRAVVQNEFRSANDLVDRISGGAGPGGLKAVAPRGRSRSRSRFPSRESGQHPRREADRRTRRRNVTFTSAGRPIAIISDVMIEYHAPLSGRRRRRKRHPRLQREAPVSKNPPGR
jgi:hypothetical protein